MCDIWRANANGITLTRADLAPHIQSLRKLKVRTLVLSGGEALMHSNLWTLCDDLRPIGVRIILLSTGLLLRKNAESIIDYCDEIIVSLDGSPKVHDVIRNIPRAYAKLEDGVNAVFDLESSMRITARCVIQRENFDDLMNIIATARSLGLQQLSFLAADVSTDAFNRPGGWSDDRIATVALNEQEARDFRQNLLNNSAALDEAHKEGFLAEPLDKLLAIADYYLALNGKNDFPPVRCNAPWVSAVVEPGGDIRPCFFHPAYGNLADCDISESLNSSDAVEFRRKLDVTSNPICRRCVCSLNL